LSAGWTLERIAQLCAQDIRQLRDNAERLNETGIAELCSEVLRSAAHHGGSRAGIAKGTPRATKAVRLLPRGRAFEARGVWLQDARRSWGGVRASDGTVVLALWAGSIESAHGSCSYLLWAPNVAGSRPWSDTPAGKERLEHCKLALARGRAEGLLVHGEALNDRLPEERAYSVHGVDPHAHVVFTVERRGPEYWAAWGRKAAPQLREESWQKKK
jgi:hypothetical protein